MSWTDAYMKRFYDRERGWVDGTTEFHALCARHAGARILEVGAGPTNATSTFLATLGELHGTDPDPAVHGNTALASATVMTGDRIPVGDGAFDLCVSNYVLEHVADPRAHLAEVRRVLAPGGRYAFRTPNRFHYVSLVSSLTPHWFHVAVANRLRGLDRDAHDPYPTYYRLNTRDALQRHARAAGLAVGELRLVEKEPSYGMGSPAMFLAGVAYERLANAHAVLAPLRANIFGWLSRP
jgi:SAM-dependent methyltransferase